MLDFTLALDDSDVGHSCRKIRLLPLGSKSLGLAPSSSLSFAFTSSLPRMTGTGQNPRSAGVAASLRAATAAPSAWRSGRPKIALGGPPRRP